MTSIGNYIDFTVYFIKVDEVYGYIQCEDFDRIIELREKFSFFADGYQFHPAFKEKLWDGKIRLLNDNNLIRLGLYGEVEKYCNSLNIPFKLDPKIKKLNLPQEKFDRFVESLNIHIGGDKINPYDYQLDATKIALESKRRILLSPTSSGKSLIMYMILRMWEKIFRGNTLIIVPLASLVKQLPSDFNDYSSEIDWSSEEAVWTKYIEGSENKKIILCTYQSLNTKPEEYFHQFEGVMVDEVHTAKSKSITRALDNSINAGWRIGLTGTLDECVTNEMVLQGMFGPVSTVVKTKELMDLQRVANLKITMVLLKHKKEDCSFLRSDFRGKKDKKGKDKRTKATYQEEVNFIINNIERNKFIMRFSSRLKGNTIIMIHKIEHGENLYKWFKQALPDRDILLYTGAVDVDDREVIRKSVEEMENCIIIGSLGAISTGISIKRLHNLVIGHPVKSKVKVLQSAGRLLRLSKFGNDVNIYDIVDNFCIGAYENYVYDHGKERLRYYNEEQHNYNIREINLE